MLRTVIIYPERGIGGGARDKKCKKGKCMADTLLASMFGMLDSRSVGSIAGALAAPEQSVIKGLKASIASVLGGMASKSEDPDALRHMLDLAPSGAGDATLAQFASAASDANSPMISEGRRLLSSLFGNAEPAVTNAVSAASGLRPTATSMISAITAPMVLGFLGKRVRTEGMDMRGLGNLLQRESGSIRNALPPGVAELFWPSTVKSESPVIAQTVEKEHSSSRWVPVALALVVAGLLSVWFLNRARRPTISRVAPVTTDMTSPGTANRAATDSAGVKGELSNADLKFHTGSAKLLPQCATQLDNVAATLRKNPEDHVKVEGYTDNVGNPQKNLQLSEERAHTVVVALISRGIPADRLTAEGHGEENPVGTNATGEGRARNRRVFLDVWQPQS